MHIWSVLLTLLLICCSCGVVHSQRCRYDFQCEDICCSRQCVRSRSCSGSPRISCNFDSDCSSGETCERYVCNEPSTTSFEFPTYKVYTRPDFEIPSIDPITLHHYCVWDNDCSGSLVCDDGECVQSTSAGAGFSWNGTKVVGIVLFIVVATIGSCLYHLCRRARRPPMPVLQLNRPTAEMASTTQTSTVYPGGTVTNFAVVDIQDEISLPPGAPPPYSSLEFNEQHGEVCEPPPPSYDEAVQGNRSRADLV